MGKIRSITAIARFMKANFNVFVNYELTNHKMMTLNVVTTYYSVRKYL